MKSLIKKINLHRERRLRERCVKYASIHPSEPIGITNEAIQIYNFIKGEGFVKPDPNFKISPHIKKRVKELIEQDAEKFISKTKDALYLSLCECLSKLQRDSPDE
ncbi:hypothetical protein M2459_001386 [Parabacteroides sp. PF5-5]|uniref:hypothetical protein n=1 Tax=unclassified Parabacteroides TaxID=2649774 RepID=UPI00247472CE|nr:MULTISPECIES: hypothetical protein [unclassified Parabacteroides]MDH6304650.1 hypothetical protein [Parabacteroides sp. PH5-39]MDH6315736.1 hypothetical protein [Parabacteroides sp. PF5-13]MDH6319396.1 hypothetical protein [Parabacteroides sp. PH5-13]MDH6323127.1 hypothetical protein [Parabacteroides sp. PH5-8]MDH6326929.1 hypothetical protein [Parabacteroides sp. PH5-41]